MNLLNGKVLAERIKTQQVKKASELRDIGILPRLAIIQTKDDPTINTYTKLKKRYGEDIGVEVEIHVVQHPQVAGLLKKLNADSTTHGIIIQLPLADTSQTDESVNLVSPQKDVDGLGQNADYQPATPTAILMLLEEYGISLKEKRILIIGRGKLVGEPLARELRSKNLELTVANSKTTDLEKLTLSSDVIITATGRPGLIRADMLKAGAVVVDAGTASENGKTVGDLHPKVYERDDLVLTPTKGGVGPLTVCALFENVLKAAEKIRD